MEQIMEATIHWLNKNPYLFLPCNADELRDNVESKLGHSVSAESVSRARRKAWENGDAIIEDPKLREEFLYIRTHNEKKYKEFFGPNRKRIVEGGN